MREAGGILENGQQIGSTMQCCHCGRHWEYVPGSGAVRSFCTRCHAVTCGNQKCVTECVPIEQWLEQQEKGVHIIGGN